MFAGFVLIGIYRNLGYVVSSYKFV